jgi:hypothetical protein
MTKAILLSEHGGIEPIIIRQHDVLFGMLTLKRFKPRSTMLQISHTLTATISILLDEDIARHAISESYHVGFYLFKLHKETMCRYIQASALNGRPSMDAIRQYYFLQGITEDDYQEESAWKAWMRWSKSRRKKPIFSKQNPDKAGVVLCEKRRARAKLSAPLRPLTLTLSEANIELATARFMSAYSGIFRSTPRRLEKHVRVYYYMTVYHMSSYEVARKLQVKPWSAWYAKCAVEEKARRNKAIARLLAEQIALPHPA